MSKVLLVLAALSLSGCGVAMLPVRAAGEVVTTTVDVVVPDF